MANQEQSKVFLEELVKDLLLNDKKEVRGYFKDHIIGACDAGLGPILCDDLDMVLCMLEYPEIKMPKEKLDTMFAKWCSHCCFETGDEKNLAIARLFMEKGAEYTSECELALINNYKYEIALLLSDGNNVDNCIRKIGVIHDLFNGSKYIGENLRWIYDFLGGSLKVCFESMLPYDAMSHAVEFKELGFEFDWQKYALEHLGECTSRECIESLCAVGVDPMKLLDVAAADGFESAYFRYGAVGFRILVSSIETPYEKTGYTLLCTKEKVIAVIKIYLEFRSFEVNSTWFACVLGILSKLGRPEYVYEVMKVLRKEGCMSFLASEYDLLEGYFNHNGLLESGQSFADRFIQICGSVKKEESVC